MLLFSVVLSEEGDHHHISYFDVLYFFQMIVGAILTALCCHCITMVGGLHYEVQILCCLSRLTSGKITSITNTELKGHTRGHTVMA